MDNPKIFAKQLASLLAVMQSSELGAVVSDENKDPEKDQGKDVKDQKDNKDTPDQQKDLKDTKDISDKQVQDKSMSDTMSTSIPPYGILGSQVHTNALLARLVASGSTGSFIPQGMRPDLMTSQLLAEADMTADEINELKTSIVSLLDAAISEAGNE